jgi:hypothetical protein
MRCDTCGRMGTEDDLCVVGDECPDDDCEGTIVPNLPGDPAQAMYDPPDDWRDYIWIWPRGDEDLKGWHVEPIGDSALLIYAPIAEPLRGLVLSHDQAVEFANAILSEVELAQRGDTE